MGGDENRRIGMGKGRDYTMHVCVVCIHVCMCVTEDRNALKPAPGIVLDYLLKYNIRNPFVAILLL